MPDELAASEELPEGYVELLRDLKERVRSAQLRAGLSANRELVLLYWSIGRDIRQRQQQQGWGAKVIARLCTDLRRAFPQMKGFSLRNLVYMQTLAASYPEEAFTQQAVAQIPWGHNVVILDKVRLPEERAWYIRATIEFGWSRSVLVHQIESNLYARQGKAITNFARTLPAPQSDLAQQILKDPYQMDFMPIGPQVAERDLEYNLVTHIRDFLLELGVGFSFVGSQYVLEVADQEFFLDLLFYHLKLRCFVIIELKATDFKPEYAGKMQFYLSAVDAQLRHETDAPSIGLILCKTRNRLIVEYTLKDSTRPIGVSEYQITAALPPTLQGSLPTLEELKAGLHDESREMAGEGPEASPEADAAE